MKRRSVRVTHVDEIEAWGTRTEFAVEVEGLDAAQVARMQMEISGTVNASLAAFRAELEQLRKARQKGVDE